jgi:putative ABC transport system permease protein
LLKSGVDSAKAEKDRTYDQMLLLWHEAMVERLRTTPGIDAATINSTGAFTDYRVEGHDEPVILHRCDIGIRSGDYFRTLRVRLVAGRLLTEEDCVPGEQTVVINQEMARRCWPGESPLGKRFFRASDGRRMDALVVGVIGNVVDFNKEVPPRPFFYVPRERPTDFLTMGGDFMIRSSLDADSLRAILDQLAREMSSERVVDFYSVEAQLRVSTAPRRIYMWLLTTMGALGLLLSALGVYAVMAYAVVRRTREIGVRMALGATRGNIARLIFGRGGRLVFGGMVFGVVAALIFSHYLESLLYQVKTGDVRTFVGVLLTLGAVAGIACYIPARRATRVNPMEALRYE